MFPRPIYPNANENLCLYVPLAPQSKQLQRFIYHQSPKPCSSILFINIVNNQSHNQLPSRKTEIILDPFLFSPHTYNQSSEHKSSSFLIPFESISFFFLCFPTPSAWILALIIYFLSCFNCLLRDPFPWLCPTLNLSSTLSPNTHSKREITSSPLLVYNPLIVLHGTSPTSG